MESLARIEALFAFPVAPDGIHERRVAAGTVFDVPVDVAVGLIAAKHAKDATGKELTQQGESDAGTTVIQPVSMTSVSTELSPEERARVTASRVDTVPAAARPNIEPVEHGGETLDRLLTRGVDADAKLVEATDPVAAAGTASAAQEIAKQVEAHPAEKDPAAIPSEATPAAAEEGKEAPPAPDDKAAPRRPSKNA